jgi:hypothetical protein
MDSVLQDAYRRRAGDRRKSFRALQRTEHLAAVV